ncbi:hypothetical protein ASPZODRAFT_20515 [Penicilliopsis zonata CBS 506.65]|uniref:FAD dependent oxidoreductase domain-containing protein n=1 Tax=Penicilliopsis zonata CBS 506.65 TaxID=1073090 RepID=A0A1L9S5G1_9EURO|nr:hypothetical protein ASPZODRAFT_20515 [Penicilliopsis zonata CBS 506.65]OJJ42398.1 hypothetical protein ASPZODRAFT_20515 [Penicilliopsis zonata CBS 506.65]
MVKVTILGAGVTGMTIASCLPKDSEITIVGAHLPGDAPSKEWASPWAAAIWVGVHESSPREQAMQLRAFAGLWALAETDPASSVRRTTVTEIMDMGCKADVWYQYKVPDFRFLGPGELPQGALYGMRYSSVVITPTVFLPWMAARLQAQGVRFQRLKVTSLAQLQGMGHDILINASGYGSKTLLDVQDSAMLPVRLQSAIIKHPTYQGLHIHRGRDYYSTQFSRLDGTVYIGGIIEYGSDDVSVTEDGRDLIFRRAHQEQPEVFTSPDAQDYDLVSDHTGFYPMRARDKGGVRVEKELLGSQKVIHAYGQHAGGYVFSFGIAHEVANLVAEFMDQIPATSTPVRPARLS